MHKNEFELQKLIVRSKNVEQYLGFAKHIATMGFGTFCVYLIFEGLSKIAGNNSSSLIALASVIEKLHPSSFLSLLIGAGGIAGWGYERVGKKRLLKKVSENRKSIESKDPYNASSGLTDAGETPS